MKAQPLSLLSTLLLASVCSSLLATPLAAQRLPNPDSQALVIGDGGDNQQDQVSLDQNGDRRVNIDGIDVHFKLGKSDRRRTDIRSFRHALDRSHHNEDYDEKHITIHPDGSTVARRFRRSLGNRRTGGRHPARRSRRGGRRGRGVNIRLGFSRFGQRLRTRFNPRNKRNKGTKAVSAFRQRVRAIVAAVNRGADDATVKQLVRAAAGARAAAAARARGARRGRQSRAGREGRWSAKRAAEAAAEEEAPTSKPVARGGGRRGGRGGKLVGLVGKIRGKVGGKLRGKVGGGRLIKGAFNKIRGKIEGRTGGKVGGGRLIKGAFNKIRGKIEGRTGQKIGGGRLIKGAFNKIKGKIEGRAGQKIGGGRLIRSIKGKIEGKVGQKIGRGRLIRGAFNKIKGRIEQKTGRQIGGGRLIKGVASQVGGKIKRKMGKGSKFLGGLKSVGGTFGIGDGQGFLSKGADAAAKKIGKGKGGRIVGGLIKGVGGMFGMRLSPYDYEPYDDLYFY